MTDVLIYEPQVLSVYYGEAENEYSIGQIVFGIAYLPEFSLDRIVAIQSDPRAIKTALVILGCKKCEDKMPIYSSLEKKDDPPAGALWYEDLPDEFVCKCGSTHITLEYLRKNMHALLTDPARPGLNAALSSLYERRALDEIGKKMLQLIDTEPSEEPIQQYLTNNPIFFHQWSPQRVFPKPPILSKYKADFIILDSHQNLIFVELERSTLKLLRKNGDASAEFNHAVEQVQSWLYEFSNHKAALLDCIGLKADDVIQAKGVVIAGRDGKYNREHLRRLKWQDRGNIEVLTYDDLLASLGVLMREMESV